MLLGGTDGLFSGETIGETALGGTIPLTGTLLEGLCNCKFAACEIMLARKFGITTDAGAWHMGTGAGSKVGAVTPNTA